MKDLDWGNLSFGYMKTDYNVRCYYRDGKWGEIEVCSDEYLNLHMAATCLHYGQEAFEGLKAYRCKDGKVRIFRVEENAARLQSTCRGILMPELPTELFIEMVKKVVRLNQEWIPTYESGATLYIRPLLIGTSAQVGVHPAKEYCFLIFVTPVGPYFKGGFSSNPYVIVRDYDRSAPSEQVSTRSVATMPHRSLPTTSLMRRVMPVSSTSMPRKRSTLTSVVPPTSSVSRTTPISLQSPPLSCPLSPTRV